ncbi:hypothetical protein LUD75_05420 [Epilithonimonas sp. JDS]|uniref:hypothetical protein n=1 Tax=Epilithonimonas sp. JDS TaxID=2902797 RepID=UPI001E5366DB|nr:hypothetical protein [Epilithonimonas sp. JDS]MCD9854131.1 hypothetical protein [Epilithonimonas sp. JDS]
MKQPWIHNGKLDSIFILSPPFLVLMTVLFFQKSLVKIEDHYSFYTWLFLIVFVDVAHVYSTLFKTYFVRSEFSKRKKLYLGIPFISLIIGILFYQLGSLIFWSSLALVAVFHFIRQQYGFMRLYSRFESNNISKKIDTLAIYSATIFPMIYWTQTPRKFDWFINGEFTWIPKVPLLLEVSQIIYILILVVYILKTFIDFLKTKQFNIPKNAIIIGTYLSWYFGIIYFDNDLIFTFLNVVSHGIPYIALIYLNEIKGKANTELKWRSAFKTGFGVLLFILVIVGFAFFEELSWEKLVWKEHFGSDIQIENWHFLLVPLLTVPQLTHYLLDGFIWKSAKK